MGSSGMLSNKTSHILRSAAGASGRRDSARWARTVTKATVGMSLVTQLDELKGHGHQYVSSDCVG